MGRWSSTRGAAGEQVAGAGGMRLLAARRLLFLKRA